MISTQLCLSLSSHTSLTRAFASCVNREMHVVYMKCTHCGYGCERCRLSTFSPSSPKKTKNDRKKNNNNNNRPGAKCGLSVEHKETVAAWTEGKPTLMLFILLTPSKRVSSWTTSNHSNRTRHHCVGFFSFFSFSFFVLFGLSLCVHHVSCFYGFVNGRLCHSRLLVNE